MCLLSAANIEYKNFEEKYHIDYYIALFGTFLAPLRNSLRSGEKQEKRLQQRNRLINSILEENNKRMEIEAMVAQLEKEEYELI